jgi:AcrR family transcriptional regulator
MNVEPPEVPKRRPGGRSARVRKAVLDAALTSLLTDGFERVSVAAIAAEAGVAESTVYRRWATKSSLVAAAIGELAASENPTPNTGSLEQDLRVVLNQILAVIGRPEIERLVRALAALGDDVPGIAEARAEFFATRVAGMRDILDRAVARGEIREGADAVEVLETLVAPAYLRLLMTGLPLDRALARRAVRAARDVAGQDPARVP